MFYHGLIIPRLDVKCRWDAIDALADLMTRDGFVTDSYCEAVKEREREFPTALPTEPIGVAIPHADLEHCVRPGISVGIMIEPIQWIEIATEDKWVNVDIVFLLSITDPQAQVVWLKRLIDAFQVEGMLRSLQSLDDEKEILQLLSRHIAG